MFTAVLYHLFVFTAQWKSLGTKELLLFWKGAGSDSDSTCLILRNQNLIWQNHYTHVKDKNTQMSWCP